MVVFAFMLIGFSDFELFESTASVLPPGGGYAPQTGGPSSSKVIFVPLMSPTRRNSNNEANNNFFNIFLRMNDRNKCVFENHLSFQY